MIYYFFIFNKQSAIKRRQVPEELSGIVPLAELDYCAVRSVFNPGWC